MEKESIFMQMHNGKRSFEGSFYKGLQKLFYLADSINSKKLVRAFPEFFGDEVPEFGIFIEAVNASCEEKNPPGNRETPAECRAYIDS